MPKRVLFTAGIGNTDRPERYDFVLHLWERLAACFEALGIHSVVAHHPCLQAQSHGCIRASVGAAADIMKDFKPDYVFLWNGNSDGDVQILTHAARFNIRPVFAELGWFPQAGHCYFDLQGVNAKSSFSRSEYPALTKDQADELADFRFAFCRGKPQPSEQHHLIVLQVESDSNILNSRYTCMLDFVHDAMAEIRGRKDGLPVLIRRHPHQLDVNLEGVEGFIWDDSHDPYQSVMAAKAVYAINSTLLLESAMLGKKIRPFGRGIIHTDLQWPRVDSLLHALIKAQLQWGDLTRIEIVRGYRPFIEAGLFERGGA